MVYEALLLQQFIKTGMFSRDCVFIIIQHGGCSMKTDVLSISGNSQKCIKQEASFHNLLTNDCGNHVFLITFRNSLIRYLILDYH